MGEPMRVTTAEELEALSPPERSEAVRSGFVTEPDSLPPHVQELRVRRDAERAVQAQRAS